MKQLPLVKKGISEDQVVRSWGQKERSGHQESLDFQTPFRLAHNHFIATSHRGEMLAPRLMAFHNRCNSSRMSKKAYRKIKTSSHTHTCVRVQPNEIPGRRNLEESRLPAQANHKTFANGSKHHRSCLAHASKFFLLCENPSPKNISQ
jgi:hypothetical protein